MDINEGGRFNIISLPYKDHFCLIGVRLLSKGLQDMRLIKTSGFRNALIVKNKTYINRMAPSERIDFNDNYF